MGGVGRIATGIMRVGVLASALILILGLLTHHMGLGRPLGALILQMGFLTLISIPIITIATSALLSARRRDLSLALTSTLVLLILLLGIALGL